MTPDSDDESQVSRLISTSRSLLLLFVLISIRLLHIISYHITFKRRTQSYIATFAESFIFC